MLRFLAVLMALTLTNPVQADFASIPWRSDKSIVGRFISADSSGFRFQIGCNGTEIAVPWQRGDQTSYFSRSTRCDTHDPHLNLQLTAGVETGGGCDNWRRGQFFQIGLLNLPPFENWIAASQIRFQRNQLQVFEIKTNRWVAVRTDDVGFMSVKADGVCLD